MNRNQESLIVFFASLILFVVHIQAIDIYGFDEARNAYCAREMQQAGEYIVPTFNGGLRSLKPPLHYWFMILGYELFGYGGFGARVFSGLFGALTVLVVFWFGRKHWGRAVAWGAAGILCSSIHLSVQVHQSVPDPFLLFFMTAGALLLYDGWKSDHKLTHFWAYFLLGFGILCKGPIALLLPGFTVFLFLLATRSFSWRSIVRFHPFWGVLLSIAVALPWFVAVHRMTDGAFTEGFFMKHNFRRFSEPLEGHGGLFLITWAYVMVGMLPFSWSLGTAIPYWIKARKGLSPKMIFVLCAAVAIVSFFSISGTKLINYTVPSYPFIALALSVYWTDRIRNGALRPLGFLMWVNLILGFSVVVAAVVLVRQDPILVNLSNGLWILSGLVLGPVLGLFFWRKLKPSKALVALGAGHALTGIFFFVVLTPKLDDINPVRVLEAHVEEPSRAVVIGYQHFNPAFVSIWDRPIQNYWSSDNVRRFVQNQKQPVYAVLQERSLDDLQLSLRVDTLGMHPDLFERQVSVLLKIYPDEAK